MRLLLLPALTGVLACTPPAVPEKPDATPAAGTMDVTAAPSPALPSASPDETDRLALAEARAACANRDFKALFDAMIRSPSVRRTYSAPKIVRITRSEDYAELERTTVDAANYSAFPVRLEDYYRRPTSPPTEAGAEEYILLSFSQSQSDDIAVEWTRVRYVGVPEGGDDLGQAVHLDGRAYVAGDPADGTLLLRPVDNCWVLAVDDRIGR